jgi:hypothetical protein
MKTAYIILALFLFVGIRLSAQNGYPNPSICDSVYEHYNDFWVHFPKYIQTDKYYNDTLFMSEVFLYNRFYLYEFLSALAVLNEGDYDSAKTFLQRYDYDVTVKGDHEYYLHYPNSYITLAWFSYRELLFANIWNRQFLKMIVNSKDTLLDFTLKNHPSSSVSLDSNYELWDISNRTLAKRRLIELNKLGRTHCLKRQRDILNYCDANMRERRLKKQISLEVFSSN